MAKLRSLVKTCNFGDYLETAIRDQFVCGIRDTNCQKELLCQTVLTAEGALQRARAAEVVRKETESMQDAIAKRESENFPSDGEINAVYRNTPCYRCGKLGHAAAECRFKTAKMSCVPKNRAFSESLFITAEKQFY